jgi:parallel beta-helix repeat protein
MNIYKQKKLVVKYIIVILLAGLHSLAPLSARIIHVAKSGSDSNPGTQSEPYLTINHAAQLAMPGDTVIVHEGIYREHVNPARGGTGEDARITYKAAEGEQAVIKGSERITTWVKETDPAFESGVWRVELDASKFPYNFNPYTRLIATQWTKNGVNSHCGDVYLNGDGLKEHKTADQKDGEFAPPKAQAHEISQGQWFTSTKYKTTTIWAHFGTLNPNEELVEINWREVVFFPTRSDIHYITVSGFTMMHAASGPISDYFETGSVIGPHMGRSWIIENNYISYGRRKGISLGRSQSNKDESKYEEYGHHIIRNNVITKCGMNGIHGFYGCFKTVIDRNIIEDNNFRNEFSEWTTSSIKMLFAQDLVISRNIIRKANLGTANYGIWIDNGNQNVRITSNIIELGKKAIEIEISHGPVLIDNNILIYNELDKKPKDLKFRAGSGIITAHNLFINTKMSYRTDKNRGAAIFEPHTTKKIGYQNFDYSPWFRIYNNLALGVDLDENFDKSSVSGNVLLGSTGRENLYDLYLPDLEPNFSYNVENDGFRLQFDAPAELTGDFTSMVDCSALGKVLITNMRMVNPDESDIFINKDIFGEARDSVSPVAGPFENVQPGTNSYWFPWFDSNTTPEIISVNLPGGAIGEDYSAGIKVSKGNGPFNWHIKEGALPPGLVIDNGVILGTPTDTGKYDFTMELTDFDKDKAEQNFTIVVDTLTTDSFKANFSSDKSTVKKGENIQFYNKSEGSPTSLKWTFEGGTPANSTEKNPVVTYNIPGVFMVTLVAANASNCDSITKTAYVTVTDTLISTSVNQVVKNIRVYPNPVSDKLYLINMADSEEVYVFDAVGQKIQARIQDSFIDVSHYKPGLYFVVATSLGNEQRIKFIKL